MKSLRILLMVLASFASLSAMATHPVPIINYEGIAVSGPAGQQVTEIQVKQAIQNAASAKQWEIADEGPGRMLATLRVRGKHFVSTQISYSAEKISLVYKDSINLNYSPGADGQGLIHPSYNRWVQNLKEAIRASLAGG